MPWFPIPFVLNEHGNLKTENYRYTEVSWTDGREPGIVSPALISKNVTTVGAFEYISGMSLDLGTTTPPPNKRVTPYIVMNTNCSEISFTARPRLQMLAYDNGTGAYVYRMRYKLKIRKNPKAQTEKNTFKIKVCTQSICYRPYFYYLCTNPFGTKGYWGGTSDLWQYSLRDAILDLHFAVDGTAQVKRIEKPRGVDITHGVLYKAGITVYKYRDYGPLYDQYAGLTKEDVYTEYEVTFDDEDSYLYLTLSGDFYSPQVQTGFARHIFTNQDITVIGRIYAAIELENEDDVIYGDGFSNIYLGENNVEPGMIFKDQIEPTEIYIGENLVWSN